MKHQGKRTVVVHPVADGRVGRNLEARAAAQSVLFQQHVPPSVLIDADCICVGFFGAVQPYLNPAREREASSLFAIARENVRERLRTILRHALPEGSGELDHAFGEHNDIGDSVDIAVLPVQVERDTFLLVSFLEKHPASQLRCEPYLIHIVGENGALEQFRYRSGDNPARVEGLSPRQRTVLFLVANGRSNKQIAGDLGISQRTVEAHRVIVMRKLGARNFAELMRLMTTH
jgi:DNA-binding CsgD family transcriptional regulator